MVQQRNDVVGAHLTFSESVSANHSCRTNQNVNNTSMLQGENGSSLLSQNGTELAVTMRYTLLAAKTLSANQPDITILLSVLDQDNIKRLLDLATSLDDTCITSHIKQQLLLT